MTDRTYLGPPGLTLGNGRPLEYGETVTLDADAEKDPVNEGLIAAGHLPENPKPAKPRTQENA